MQLRREGLIKMVSIPIKKINNKLLDYSYRRQRVFSLGMPKQLFIEPTNYCNAACPLCPVGAHELKRNYGQMKIESFDNILQKFGCFLEEIYFWNYGEPFLNPEIFDMVKKAHQMSIKTTISTNGTGLYKNENIHKILSSGLDLFIVSLDGATAEVFNKYRVGVDFEQVINGLNTLVQEKKKLHVLTPEIEIQFLVMKHNYSQISIVKQLANELGVKLTFKSVNIEFLGRDLKIGETCLPEDDKYNRYIRSSENYLPRFSREKLCYQLWHSLVINWDGSVVPCCKDYDNICLLGNILSEGPRSIWNGKTMRSLRKVFLKTPDLIPLCADCFLTDFSNIKVLNN